MAKPQRFCQFCGAGGLVKGHVWPEWLLRYDIGRADLHDDFTGHFDTFEPRVPGPPRSHKVHQGPVGSRKRKIACKSCDGGWMGRIDEAAKRPSLSIIRGTGKVLSRDDQAALVRWIALVAMRADFLDNALQAVPPEDRKHLMDCAEPPPHWRIWISRFDSDSTALSLRRTAFRAAAPIGPLLPADKNARRTECNSQVVTIVIGKMCAHIFMSTLVAPPVDYIGLDLKRIWPPLGYNLVWPLVSIISKEEMIDLSEAMPRLFNAQVTV